MTTPRSATQRRCARFAFHLLAALGAAGCGNADAEGDASTCEGGPDVTSLAPGSKQRAEVCVEAEGDGCAPVDDAELDDRLRSTLGGAEVQGCDCECRANLVEVTCGAPIDNARCCYDVVVDVSDHCGKGRDFVIDGVLRTAPLASRADWTDALEAVSPLPSPAACSLLADAWARDGLLEHASVAAFARFTLEALAVGAPAELVRAAQVAAAEEVGHAEMCFALASRFAGAPIGPGALDVGRQLELRESLASIAAASVIEGCIGETISAFRALAARDTANDPAVRAMLSRVGRDETSHAELSWRFVAWAIERGGAEVARAVAEAFAHGEQLAIATRAALTAPRLANPADLAGELEAHGRLSPTADVMVRDEVWEQVIRPAARRLLGAAGGERDCEHRRTDTESGRAGDERVILI